MIFRDRIDAGNRLASALLKYAGADVVVYTLPRGGVVLGAEIAHILGVPLDLVIPRKVGHPMSPEYAICAVSESGHLICNEQETTRLDPQWLQNAIEREKREAQRRRQQYMTNQPSFSPEGKIAILVDDGVATGLTMRVAIKEIKGRHPAKVVVAVPVGPRDTLEVLRREADEVVVVEEPYIFAGAIGAYYQDFRPVEDEEVIRLLQQENRALVS